MVLCSVFLLGDFDLFKFMFFELADLLIDLLDLLWDFWLDMDLERSKDLDLLALLVAGEGENVWFEI